MLNACVSSKEHENSVGLLSHIVDSPKEITIKNDFSINNQGGHIQGVQLFPHPSGKYYFFSGSSNNQSYYAIANEEKIISVNKFLDEPFRHAGGFQIAHNLLAVGIEDNVKKDRSKVLLFKIKDPEKPSNTTFKSGGGIYLDEQKKIHILSSGHHITESIKVNHTTGHG